MNDMIEKVFLQKEAIILRDNHVQMKVCELQKKNCNTNDLETFPNKKNIKMKNCIQKKNEVLVYEKTKQKYRKVIQKDAMQDDNDPNDVDGNTSHSSANVQESLKHFPHEPVCDIKEEPLEDSIGTYMYDTHVHMEWLESESAFVESDGSYNGKAPLQRNLKGRKKLNDMCIAHKTAIKSKKVLPRGSKKDGRLKRNMCRSQQKSSKKFVRAHHHVEELKNLKEENALLRAQLNQLKKNQKVNECKDIASRGAHSNGGEVAQDHFPSEMLLVKIPCQLGDDAFYCATCNFKCNKRAFIIKHSFVHLIDNEREVAVPDVQPKLLNVEEFSTPRSYQCPECSHVSSRKSSLKVHLDSHKDGENELYDINDPDDPDYAEEEIHNEHNHEHSTSVPKFKEKSFPKAKHMKCSKCRFKTNNQEDLDLHIVIHANSKEYICVKCEKCWHSKLRFSKHKQLYHLPKDLACTLCSYNASEQYMLEWHLYQHTGEMNFHCHHCKERFDNNWTFKNHCILVHKLEIYHNCNECDFVAKEVNEIDVHMFTHSGIKPLKCPDCDFKCCMPRQLTKHKKLKHDKAPLRCYKCYFETRNYSKFDEHLDSHTWDIKYFCYLCNISTDSLSAFKDHRLTSHYLDNYLDCTECDVTSEDTEKLAIHMFKHFRKKLLHCSKCEFRTNSLVYIKRHIHAKHGDFPFQCTECDYKTNDKIPFDRHLLGHTLAIKYFCYHCKEQFDHLWTFKKHRQRVHSLSNYLKCIECDFTAVNMNSLAQHMFNHSRIKALQCSQCDYSGCQFTHIKRHIQLKHGESSYKCIPCDFKASDKLNFDKHMSEHDNKGFNYRCYHCQEKFEHLWTLKNHCLFIHKLKNYLSCIECDYTAIDRNDIGEHVAKHRGMVLIQCSYCDYTCYQPMNLESHIQLKHAAAITYHCNECDFNSPDKDNYMNHVNKHKEEIRFDCSHCKENFDQLSYLKKHYLEEHKIENYLACIECDYVGKNQAHLSRHLYDAHKIGNLLQCPQCQYISYWPQELQDHIRVNHAGAPLRCPVCEKGFTAKNDLERHIRSHTGEKPFLCEDCGKRFPAKRSLKNHIDVVHKKIRPFSCTECDRKFPNKSEYDIHIRTHKEGKKFVCDTCGIGFLKRNALNKHMEIHQDRLYKCPDCGFLCKTSSNIRQHLMVRHEYKAKDGYKFDPQSMLISGESITTRQIQSYNKTYAKPEKKVKEREHSDKLYQCPHCCAYKGNTRMAIRTHVNKVHGLFAKQGYKFNFQAMLVTDPDPGLMRPHFKPPIEAAQQQQLQDQTKSTKNRIQHPNHLNMPGTMTMNDDSSNSTSLQVNNCGYGMPVDLAIPRNSNVTMHERGYALPNIAQNEVGYMAPNLGEFSRHSANMEVTEQQRMANRFYSMAPYNQFMF